MPQSKTRRYGGHGWAVGHRFKKSRRQTCQRCAHTFEAKSLRPYCRKCARERKAERAKWAAS